MIFTCHRECSHPSTSTTTFNSFILMLNNIIHSSISTATPINIATNIFMCHDWITIQYHLYETCFILYLVSFLCYHSIDRQTIFDILISISYNFGISCVYHLILTNPVFIRINFICVHSSHLNQKESFIAFKQFEMAITPSKLFHTISLYYYDFTDFVPDYPEYA
ncbi:hypothetical protein BLOT_013184, partial [Blomia tropicalis]